ncbi:hypothetical protein SKAU_G00122480 [Synaphobranchus kaupii]|uniref:Uncharacterized protein n=1 Tax=Synaphobranchus kaupii TaxID=118154 RepID=A0A9Q1FPQ5_SYNKA|nr:hypothetical protein SKAU_G00122480 [Synaphobranchus kaupii]
MEFGLIAFKASRSGRLLKTALESHQDSRRDGRLAAIHAETRPHGPLELFTARPEARPGGECASHGALNRLGSSDAHLSIGAACLLRPIIRA